MKKKIRDVLDRKKTHFKNGKANQADANYFSYKILRKFPSILSVLAKKYSHLIIDEAQDTTDLQMLIIDLLDSSNIDNVMFVGDPNQAIFEWNTADPELFKRKYNNSGYRKIDLDENRRSSVKICEVLNRMVSETSASISDVKEDKNTPKVIGYDPDQNTQIHSIKNDFIRKCENLEIPLKRSAVLFRGKKFGEEHFQLIDENFEDPPWKNGHYHVRDICHGKYLSEKGQFKVGIKLLEKGYHKLTKENLDYVSKKFINEKIAENGFRLYREKLFRFIELLPDTTDKDLSSWITEANAILNTNSYPELKIKPSKGSIKLKNIFHMTETTDYPFVIGTIHSVKGQTFDAVLLFLIKRAGQSHYVNLMKKQSSALNKRQKEEMRLVYVACSRPKRLLWVAVPNEDQETWNHYFGLNSVNEKMNKVG